LKPSDKDAAPGPTFKHIYNKFLGPTYNGEFIPGTDPKQPGMSIYVLSYPGVAFTFPMSNAVYSPDKDVVSLLSSATWQVATSMAVFAGDSWAAARDSLWTEVLPSVKSFPPLVKGKDVSPDEISLVRIHGGGKLQLFRRWRMDNFFWIRLGETTPQDLVSQLGPPDYIFRKNDQPMHIHKMRTASNSRSRSASNDYGYNKRHDDLTDTDQSSAHTTTDDDSNEEAIDDDAVGSVSDECFYNYFYLGFDILVSTATAPSATPPSQKGQNIAESHIKIESPDRLVATKVILHGNVPGSYPFNRHRRCRWELSYLPHQDPPIDSETPFKQVEESLRQEWAGIYASEEEAKQQQRGMVLNRGWGDSPGSSVELLGGWEGDLGREQGRGVQEGKDSTTTLYGFPGMVFEVLKNGCVSAVTIF